MHANRVFDSTALAKELERQAYEISGKSWNEVLNDWVFSETLVAREDVYAIIRAVRVELKYHIEDRLEPCELRPPD